MNSKQKGDAFENKIARALSVWLIDGQWEKAPVTKLPFRRRFTTGTPLEGHWDGAGDILHKPGIHFPICVECKKHEGWELDGIFSANWTPWGWWEQCREQAERVRLTPLLFFSRNRRKVYCIIDEGTQQCLRLQPRSGPVLQVNGKENVVYLSTLENLVAVPRRSVAELGSL